MLPVADSPPSPPTLSPSPSPSPRSPPRLSQAAGRASAEKTAPNAKSRRVCFIFSRENATVSQVLGFDWSVEPSPINSQKILKILHRDPVRPNFDLHYLSSLSVARRLSPLFSTRAALLTLATLLVACETRTFVVGVNGTQGGSGGSSIPCIFDTNSCQTNRECCSGLCEQNLCVPLGSPCTTAGNRCEGNSDCCSALCSGGICSQASSYCAQTSDTCESDPDCCSRRCTLTTTGVLGTCGEAPQGPSNCKGIAGTVCGDCNECCSRLCSPFGDSGLSICQGASGCRQTGEICATDGECCGGAPDSALPGAGNVACIVEVGAAFGVCRNALSCSPQGNVCHIQDYACSVSSASNRCCDGEAALGTCMLDDVGIPRCNGLLDCLDAGTPCAMNDDCCENRCLPNANGLLTCQAEDECVAELGGCTRSSDCCSRLDCKPSANSGFGKCEPE